MPIPEKEWAFFYKYNQADNESGKFNAQLSSVYFTLQWENISYRKNRNQEAEFNE